MVSTHEKWIRIFDIPEISEHKNGFTIYKVVSMVSEMNTLKFKKFSKYFSSFIRNLAQMQ